MKLLEMNINAIKLALNINQAKALSVSVQNKM
jgi:hypothetical protein